MQRLQSAVIEQRTLWESIILVVAFNMLYDNFEMTTAPLLYFGDKDFEEIQQIVMFIEVANLAKRRVGATTDLAMIARKKHLDKQHATKSKANKECFNYEKKGHYANNYHPSNKKKLKKSAEEVKYTRWKRNQTNKAAAARLTTDHDNSKAKPYPASRTFMTRRVLADEKRLEVWYLNLCV